MKHTRSLVILTIVLVESTSPLVGQTPVGTAFSYQGQLKQSGVPVNATADFEFWLWDADVGGNLVAPPLSVDSWPVANGLFTVRLDFGPNAFPGQARWLEIAVRSPAGSGDYTTLAPRQELTPAPNAMYAEYATAAGTVPGMLTGGGTTNYLAKFTGGSIVGNSAVFESAGNVGIGTASPLARLHAVGSPGGDLVMEGTTGWAGLALRSAGTGFVQIYTPGASDDLRFAFDNIERMAITSAGNVGIGTTTPGFPLTFANTLGDKISLWGQSGVHYGLGMQANLLQICTAASSDDIALGYGSSASFGEIMRIKGTGNVGIGTTTPQASLHVKTAGGQAYVQVETPGPESGIALYSAGSPLYGAMYYTGTSNTLGFWAGATTRMAIRSDGNVGIGMTAPNSRLHVNGDGTSPSLRVQVSGASRLTVAENGGVSIGALQDSPPASGLYVAGDVGIGTATPGGKLHVVDATGGDTSVVLPNNSISRTEIYDEPGVASATETSYVVLDGTLETLLSRTITVPTAGHVLVIGTCQAEIQHTNGTLSWALFGVSDTSSAFPANQTMRLQLASAAATGVYDFSPTVHGLFSVAAGANTFYLLGEENGGNFWVYDRQLSLVFFPTAYGTVQPTFRGAVTSGDKKAAVPRSGLTPEEIAAEQAEAKAFHLARIERELAEMRAEIEQLKKQRGDAPEDAAPVSDETGGVR